MAEPIDINEARRKKDDDGESIWECPECGCGLFWCLYEGPIVCANCGMTAENILVTEI